MINNFYFMRTLLYLLKNFIKSYEINSIYSLYDLVTTDNIEKIIDMIQIENDLNFDIVPIYVSSEISVEDLLELIKGNDLRYEMILYSFSKLMLGEDFLTADTPQLEVIGENSLGINGIKLIEINNDVDSQYDASNPSSPSSSYLNLFFNLVLKGNIIYTIDIDDDKISFLLNLLSKVSDRKFYLIGSSIKLNDQLINKITAEFMIGKFYRQLVLNEIASKKQKDMFYNTTYFNNYLSLKIREKIDNKVSEEYSSKTIELDDKYNHILRSYVNRSTIIGAEYVKNYINNITTNRQFYNFAQELLPYNEEIFDDDKYLYLYRVEKFSYTSSGKLYEDLHIGEQITLMRPTSTSYESAMYSNFAGNILVRYKIKKNTAFICPTCTGVMMSETEILLPENSNFVCVRKWYNIVYKKDRTIQSIFVVDFDSI